MMAKLPCPPWVHEVNREFAFLIVGQKIARFVDGHTTSLLSFDQPSTTAGLCALFCLWWRRCGAMSSRSKAEHWAQELEAVAGRIAPQFGRAEPRRRALTYLQGLLAPLERKNGWHLAEAAGDCSPHGMQEFLSRVHWDADALRDDLRAYVV